MTHRFFGGSNFLELEQLFDPLSVVRQKDGAIARGVDGAAAVDAQLLIDRGSDVFGQVRPFGDIAAVAVGAADDLAAGNAGPGEGVRARAARIRGRRCWLVAAVLMPTPSLRHAPVTARRHSPGTPAIPGSDTG